MHDHYFKATDIPGVCLCECGVERYYARELQDYVITEREGECDKCANSYELSSRDNRCGDCGNCGNCCTHTAGEGK